MMRTFEWEDGFTPYSATWDGVMLTEYAGEAVERRSTLSRRPDWDGHPNRVDNAMTDAFSAGDVAGEAAVWIDGEAFELLPVRVAVIRAEHTLSPNGYCRCGLTGRLSEARHAAHVEAVAR